jgi:asparagine synthase (glutamine-hydrolysing)
MYVDMKSYLPDDILVKVDRATMAHGLESRAPFLNHELVEFAASLPVDLKLKGMRKKYLLKHAQRNILPMEIIEKRKQGFGAPVAAWLEGPLRGFADDVLSDSSLYAWFDPKQVENLRLQHRRKEKDNGHKLFGLLCFGLWLQSLKESKIAAAVR